MGMGRTEHSAKSTIESPDADVQYTPRICVPPPHEAEHPAHVVVTYVYEPEPVPDPVHDVIWHGVVGDGTCVRV